MSHLHLHHLQNSRSFRILWLLEELELDYQMTFYERNHAGLAPDTMERIHPLGKAPILEVDAKPLIESGHIIDYLMAKYDTDFKWHPKTDADDPSWLSYDFWMHFAEATAMPPLVMRLIFSKMVEKSPVLIKPVAKTIRHQVEESMIGKNIDKVLNMIESHLSQNKWFAGSDFSASDIQMAFVVEAANAGDGLDHSQYVNVLNFIKRCQSRPAYQRAVEKGGSLGF